MDQRPRKGARALDIDGSKWWWFCSKATTVLIWEPSGKKHVTRLSTVRNLTEDVVERGQWKRTSDGALTPFQVKRYIRRQLHSDG